MKLHTWGRVVLAGTALHHGSAFACGDWEASKFAAALIFVTAAILFLTLLAWGLQKLLVKKTTESQSQWAHTFFISSTITGLMLGTIGTFLVPDFISVFDSFGVDLPAPTQLLLNASHALWIPLILGLLLRRTINRSAHPTCFAGLMLMGQMLLLTFVLWLLYSPIFMLGCMV